MKRWSDIVGITDSSKIVNTNEEHNNVLRNEATIFQSNKEQS